MTSTGTALDLVRAREAAASVTDPELPMLTLADLGVLRSVTEEDGRVVVGLTPTYSGCPAMATMRDDLVASLAAAGYDAVVRVELSPPWSSDDITPQGRDVLRRHGISPPGAAGPAAAGPVALTLVPRRRDVTCPRCGASGVRLVSEFGSTACKAIYACGACGEPFDHVKEI
ncbi:phenylacetate-CoA oxygenase subunit PaaJ [Nocardioides sp. HDW12B]|uniref:1,2-phenylacetyl-CoA epoxidase subunit PaaD n=1 Tax=Nocardioides sp. HDW12B TaxID=2714939 RepID=UPI00140A7106|nr:1,2-phenylacetyl-CoA epoxidase subunit PaaD [Nocardioides sp. HDW12B]QIK67208.1 phenylacetate-CoA oxygenase subunit PaaJ [Nocardioides sp. HDW12B]